MMTQTFVSAPSEIRVKDKGRLLSITFAEHGSFDLPAEYLRVESPSAEVQGHNAKEKKIVAGKRDVTITGAEPVGNYAVRLIFSDGHSSGIFAWETFLTLGQKQDELWTNYLKNMEEKGLSR